MTHLLLLAALAAPPVDAPGAARPERHWDLEHMDLAVRLLPDQGRVEGEVTHHVRPYALPADELVLHQVGLDVTAVEVDGAPVAFRQEADTLRIPAGHDAPHTVRVTWTAHPDTGLHFRTPRTGSRGVAEVWTQGEAEDHRHWFPSWDHPSDRFTVAVTVTAPSALHVVANGVLEGAAPAGPGETTWRYRLDAPIVNYLVAVTAGEHRVLPLPGGDVPLEAVVPRTVPEAAVRRTLDETGPLLAWLTELLGHPYPYPIYRQIVVQRFLYGGMENASATILDDDHLIDDPADPALRTRRVVAHEAVHQWFGDLLTCHGWRELWLNEGFARFYDLRWVEHVHGAPTYARELVRLQEWGRGTTRPMAARGWSAVDDRPNTSVYARGATVLHMLRTWLGDDRFDAAIRDYVARHAGDLVTTDDLRRVFEDHTGQDLGWFFDPWVHGYGAPTLTTRHAWSDGTLTVTIDQQDAPWGPYRGPVEVAWEAADGTIGRHRTTLGPGASRIVVPVDEGVAWVAVDPRGGVLATWEPTQSAQAWAAQATRAPDPWARLAAIRQLGEIDAEEPALDALDAVLADEDPRSLPYAQEAVAALGVRGSPGALDRLLALSPAHLARTELRLGLARALGELALDPRAEARLRALGADPHPDVRGAALSALAAVRPSAALPAARRAIGASPSPRGQPVASAVEVLGQHGEATDLRAVTRLVDHPARPIQHAAVRAAVALATRHEVGPRERRQVAAALEGLLAHPDQLTRSLATLQLGQLGDPASAGPLRAYAATTRLDAHRESARTALQAVLAQRASPDDPDAMEEARAALEVLEERVKELEERLEELEHRR